MLVSVDPAIDHQKRGSHIMTLSLTALKASLQRPNQIAIQRRRRKILLRIRSIHAPLFATTATNLVIGRRTVRWLMSLALSVSAPRSCGETSCHYRQAQGKTFSKTFVWRHEEGQQSSRGWVLRRLVHAYVLHILAMRRGWHSRRKLRLLVPF